MSTYILGIDVGTTSVKAVLLETGSRSVAATHTAPTTSDITDSDGVKVSAPPCHTALPSSPVTPALLRAPLVNLAVFPPHPGEGAGPGPDRGRSEPVRRSAAQRRTAAGQQHRAVRADARGFILESTAR